MRALKACACLLLVLMYTGGSLFALGLLFVGFVNLLSPHGKLGLGVLCNVSACLLLIVLGMLWAAVDDLADHLALELWG